MHIIPQFMLPYELNKLNLLNKQCFYWKFRIIKCYAVSTVTTCIWMLSFGIDTAPQSFCHLFVVLPIIHCSKSAQKSVVQVS